MDDPLSKAPDRIAGMFDAIASRYDLLNHLLSAGTDRHWRRQAIRALSLSGGETLLDLCTGTADLAITARLAAPGAARVVGVDFSSAMLRVGLAKLRRQRLDRSVNLVRGDATDMPVAGQSVDGVTVAFGIRNIERPDRACAEIRRVLRPGGRLSVLEFAIPGNVLLRAAYLWYFQQVLPRIGRAVSRHGQAYQYLPASVSSFSTPDEFVKILQGCGFAEINAVPLTFGIVFLYTARRS